MARKCAFLDIDATAFKKLILSNVGSEEGGGGGGQRQSGFPNAADKEDLYAKVIPNHPFYTLVYISPFHNFLIISMTDLQKRYLRYKCNFLLYIYLHTFALFQLLLLMLRGIVDKLGNFKYSNA